MATRFLPLLLAPCLALASCEFLRAPDGGSAAVEEPPAPAGAAVPEAGPENLLGLDGAAVVALLGEPAFAWSEGEGTMWRYDAASCSLLVFLYPDGVRHTESLSREMDSAACLCAMSHTCR